MSKRLIGENIQWVSQFGDFNHWVKADSSQMEQVIMNLVINARDAMTQWRYYCTVSTQLSVL